tara:strand:+ start:38 stop:1018 length:981 start_codon:yes stop_codon:yes gene_type:complete
MFEAGTIPETMMYAGANPWHNSGTYVGDVGLEPIEAMRKAEIDWTVSKREVVVPFGDNLIPVQDYRAIVRDSDQSILGITGKDYQPFQNLSLAELARDLTGDGSMRIHTAGSLNGGRQVWMLGKVGSTEVVPGDKVDQFLFFHNGHGGKNALRCIFTDIRVVCSNTAQVALQGAKGAGVSIRHTKNMEVRVGEARRILGIGTKAFDESAEFMKKLAEIPMPTSDWIDFCLEMFPTPIEDENGEVSKRAMTRAENNRKTITSLFYDGRGADIPGVRGTAWGAYNALTEYAGYYRQTRGGQDKRFESLMMGSGADFVRRGTTVLRSLV